MEAPAPTGEALAHLESGPSGWPSTGLGTPPRGLDAAHVAFVVDQRAHVVVVALCQVVLQQVGLLAAELEQHHPTPPQEAGTFAQDAPEEVGAVRATVVGQRGFERQGVALQHGEGGGRHIGDDGNDDVGAAQQRVRQRCEEIALERLDPVGPCARDGTWVDV